MQSVREIVEAHRVSDKRLAQVVTKGDEVEH